MKKDDASGAVPKALRVLETVAARRRPLSIAEIAAALDLPQPTAHRIVGSLEKLGFVGREPGRRRIVEGARFVRLGLDVLRAAEHIEPWLPGLRKRLGAATSDEDLLLHAFYDDALVRALRDPAPDCEASTTPLRELVKWLHDRRDIQRARIRFAGTEISFSA